MFHLGIVLEFLMQMCVFVLISHQHNYLLQKGNHSRCFLEFHTIFFFTKKKYYLVVRYAIPQLLVSFILMGGWLAFCFLMDVKTCRGGIILHSC